LTRLEDIRILLFWILEIVQEGDFESTTSRRNIRRVPF
jgi:hypothetical protein